MSTSVQCVRCLYTSDHPFGITFDSEGVCSGCRTHLEKQSFDIDKRRSIFLEHIQNIQDSSLARNLDYDCILPVRGTPEYFYLVNYVKNTLKLNPLVVAYNSQFNSFVGIQNLDLIRHVFDVDLIHYTSNPIVYKKLIRHSLSSFDSIRWPFLAGETSFPVRIAVEKNIPLIIWAYHQPTEQVGIHSYDHFNRMTRHSRHEFDLMGHEGHQIIDVGSLVSSNDIFDVSYPFNMDLLKHKIVGLYASNYIPWDSKEYAEEMIKRFGAKSALNGRTFDTYDRVDDMTYMSIHDVIKYCKLGYSRVRDNLCREIRFGRITRLDALDAENYYTSLSAEEGVERFLDWLGMDYQSFNWFLKRLPYYETYQKLTRNTTVVSAPPISCDFTANSPPVNSSHRFITFGKGIVLR